MEIATFMNVEKCVFKTQVKIIVTKAKSANEDFFNVLIFDDILTEKLKISCMCAANEEESYTCILDRKIFAAMKTTQDLIINFEQFALQIKMLLEEVSKNAMQLKLKLGDEITLSFYTTSKLKILTILEIPFKMTSAEETIQFFKTKIADLITENRQLELQISDLDSENKSLRVENQNHTDLDENRKKQEEEIEEISPREQELENECILLRENYDQCLLDKANLYEDVESYRCINSAQNDALLGIASDIEMLRNGIEYYITKVKQCKEVLIDQDIALKRSVPLEKYENLYERFSTAIADLVRCQVHLKKLLTLHDLKKGQNYALRGELDKCIKTIKSLEAEHKRHKVEDMELARAGVMIEVRDLPGVQAAEVAELIRELRIQNENVNHTNIHLTKKVTEKMNKKR